MATKLGKTKTLDEARLREALRKLLLVASIWDHQETEGTGVPVNHEFHEGLLEKVVEAVEGQSFADEPLARAGETVFRREDLLLLELHDKVVDVLETFNTLKAVAARKKPTRRSAFIEPQADPDVQLTLDRLSKLLPTVSPARLREVWIKLQAAHPKKSWVSANRGPVSAARVLLLAVLRTGPSHGRLSALRQLAKPHKGRRGTATAPLMAMKAHGAAALHPDPLPYALFLLGFSTAEVRRILELHRGVELLRRTGYEVPYEEIVADLRGEPDSDPGAT